MIGGVFGAKLYYILDHLKDFQADPRGLIFSGAGLTWYGGLMGGALGALLVAHWRKIPLLTLCDIAAPLLPLSYAVGRFGCFLNGDDYGRVSNVPWAMAFPKGAPPTLERVHPTQVYEVFAGLLMSSLFLNALKVRLQGRVGALFGLYLILAGIERFIVEYFRTNAPQSWGITMAQTISLGLIVLGGWIYLARPGHLGQAGRAGAAGLGVGAHHPAGGQPGGRVGLQEVVERAAEERVRGDVPPLARGVRAAPVVPLRVAEEVAAADRGGPRLPATQAVTAVAADDAALQRGGRDARDGDPGRIRHLRQQAGADDRAVRQGEAARLSTLTPPAQNGPNCACVTDRLRPPRLASPAPLPTTDRRWSVPEQLRRLIDSCV